MPGVDDGSPSLEESVTLAKVALQDGIRTIVATPHWSPPAYAGSVSETKARVAALQAELTRRGLALELLTGSEVLVEPETTRLYASGRISSLNGSRYLLVEFPPNLVPSYAERVLFELQLQKAVPVIAHPERNLEIARDPRILERLVQRGVLAQVTAGSLMGAYGKQTMRAAEVLVKRRLVQVIASDAHSAHSRPPLLTEAVQRAARLIGQEEAVAMVTYIPATMLRDEVVEVPEVLPAARRLSFFFHRGE